MDKIFIEFLAKTLNITIEQAAELLYKDPKATEKEINENALQAILLKDAARVQAIKDAIIIDPKKEKELRDEGYQRAEKEVMTKFEDTLRSTYKTDSKKLGIELIKEVVGNAIQAANKGGELTDDKVKAHPLYTALEKKLNDDLAQLKTDHEKALTDLKSQHEKAGTVNKVKEQAKARLATLNPILAENTVVAANREADFLNKFDGYDYQFDDNGKISLILKDGKRLENAQGHPIKFDDLVKEKADLYYEYKTQQKKDPPEGGEDDKNKGHIEIPKTADEYYERLGKLSSTEDRATLTKAWDESQKGK